jgi:hypothetical protein
VWCTEQTAGFSVTFFTFISILHLKKSPNRLAVRIFIRNFAESLIFAPLQAIIRGEAGGLIYKKDVYDTEK